MSKGIRNFEDWINDPLVNADANDVVVSTEIRKILYILDGRNAWHSKWIRRYYSNRCAKDFEEAKWAVESMRVMGSTWSIVEVPALVFRGQRIALAVVEINDPAVMASTTYAADCKPFIQEIASSVEPTERHTLMRLVVEEPDELQVAGEFRTYKSSSSGGHACLNWRERDERTFDLTALQRMQDLHRQSLDLHGYLGVVYNQPVPGERTVVAEIIAGSPLAAADIKSGDVIEAMQSDGWKTEEPNAVQAKLKSISPRDTIVLHLNRNGQRISVEHEVQSFADVFGG